MNQLLFLVIAGLAVAHFYKYWISSGVEAFEDLDGLMATENDIFNRNPSRKADAPYKTAGNHGDPPMAPDEDDPRDLPWIASWTSADRAARAGHTCIVKHTEIGPANTVIHTTSHSCEAGMPHTRSEGRIIIPDSVLPTERQDIINHELIHVYQARDPDVWKQFYRKNWGFEIFKDAPASLPADLRAAKRANPDTATAPWSCWKGRWWPFAVYTDPQHPTLRGAVTVWWDTWKNAVSKEAPEGWAEFFGRVQQDEHPHEIAAVMIAGENTSSEAGRRLHQWWNGQTLYSQLRR